MTKQIALMQDLAKTETCAQNGVKEFDCSMACATTPVELVDTIERVSRAALGKCRWHHNKFTKKNNVIRDLVNAHITTYAQLSDVGNPDDFKLFADQAACSYSDLDSVEEHFREFIFRNYKANTGEKIISAFTKPYL